MEKRTRVYSAAGRWIQTRGWWVTLTWLCRNPGGESVIFSLLPWFTAVAPSWSAARTQMDWRKGGGGGGTLLRAADMCLARRKRRILKCRLWLRLLSIINHQGDMFARTHAGSASKLDLHLDRCLCAAACSGQPVWRAWITVYAQFSPVNWSIQYAERHHLFQHSNVVRTSSLCWNVGIPHRVLFNVFGGFFCSFLYTRCWRRHLSMLKLLFSVFPPEVLEGFGKVTVAIPPTVN